MVVKGVYFKSHVITRGYLKTETIDGYKGKDIMALNVTNAFIQTNIPPKKYGKEKDMMKITGVLVDMLAELDSDTYRKHVVFENGKKFINFFC